MTAVLEDLRDLSDAALADTYDRAADDAARSAVLAELGRRDAADRTARARAALDRIRHEAECAVHAQFLAASEWTRGRLLSREGVAAGIAERDLWRLPADRADRFMSEELSDYFMFVSPRLTVATYVRQHAAEARVARLEALDQGDAVASDDITDDEIGAIDDDEHASDRPRLARDDASAFRFESPAAEAPEAGGRGTVQRGGHRAELAEDAEDAGAAAGRPGRTVRPVEEGEMTENGTRAKTFAETDEIDQEWLWPGMIPAGLLTVIFGPPKASKTTLVCEYAARVSRGDVNPDGTSLGPAAPVLLGALEDISESSTIKKLRAAKADLGNVVDVSKRPGRRRAGTGT